MSFPPLLDLAAIVWLVTLWVGYSVIADLTPLHARSVAAVMDSYRQRWMMAMLQRELRIIDTSIVGAILQGVAFFASTAILMLGGLIAALGAADEAVAVLSALPFASTTTAALWELKVSVLIAVFVYAFFKLAWSFRLYQNCSILIGAAPVPQVPIAQARQYAESVGHALGFAAHHYNAGMRAYFFALAAIGWFFNAIVFFVTASVVVAVLYRREFHSRTLAAIGAGLDSAAMLTDPGGAREPVRNTGTGGGDAIG